MIISVLLSILLTVTPVQKDTVAESGYVDKIADWYDQNMNYGTITTLMAIESSFIPFPSEVVVPPAAAVSTREDSNLNMILIILFATLGALAGALVNYFLSVWLGRPIIYKFADSKLGHLCLLSGEKIKKAEEYFNDHGKVSTFVGRLIPGIRQLISIPAGLARMPIMPFMGFTLLGAGIWNTVLALIGYAVGDNMDLIYKYSHEIGYILLGVLVVALTIYIIKKRKK
ncbi:MAG: DedA family protein [bacterium]|nr:DedA family protein [Candidatus Colousia faecequi]